MASDQSDTVGAADIGVKAAALLLRYRADEARLEREQDAVQIRLEIVREVIASLSGQPRRRGGDKRRPWPVVGSQQQWPAAVPGEPGGDSTPPEAA